jgi:hypothetical protein
MAIWRGFDRYSHNPLNTSSLEVVGAVRFELTTF